MKRQVTQWFGPFTNPKHIGFYESYPFEADEPSQARMAYWDGSDWRGRESGGLLVYQTRMWRGLARKSTALHDRSVTPQSSEGGAE